MRNSSKQIVPVLTAGGALVLGGLAVPSASAQTPEPDGLGLAGVVPTVQDLEETDGEHFALGAASRILIPDADDGGALTDDAELLARELVTLDAEHDLGMGDVPAVVVGDGDAEAGDIVLRLGDVEAVASEEGYQLVVDGAVTITGPTDTGVFYGTRTLLQSLASSGGAQAATVVDYPAKPERSLHVDAGRKYYSPEWFEHIVRDLASIKLNQLQYHFSENEGFRLESLTHPEILSDEYITRAELEELLALAEQYHIEVVPALDMPGHLRQVLDAYPEYRASDTEEGRRVLDYSNPDARELIFDLVDEYAEAFPGTYWHMGGDEIFNVEDTSDPADRFPQLQEYAEEMVGPDASIHDGYVHFLNVTNERLAGHGKSNVRVWNDALYGDDTTVALDEDVDVAYWTKWHPSMPTVETIVENGHDVINFNDAFFYYVLADPGGAYENTPPASDIYEQWTPGVFPQQDWTVPEPDKPQVYDEPTPDWLVGSSYAIWSDSPDRQTEQEVAEGVWLPLRAMAERVWHPTGSTVEYAEWEQRVEAIGLAPVPADVTPPPGPEPAPPLNPGAPQFHLSNDWAGTTHHAFNFGRVGDEVFIGDWDGDGTDSVAVRRGNVFHVVNEPRGGSAEHAFDYGREGDVILVGDWDGDGKDTFAVRRDNEYFVKNSLSGGNEDVRVRYGRASDEVLVGDWDADGRDTFAVRRGNEYFVRNSLSDGNAHHAFHYGREADVVLAGDWDGDGQDTLAVRRGNTYYARNHLSAGNEHLRADFGRVSDEVLVGDWDADAADTLGIHRVP